MAEVLHTTKIFESANSLREGDWKKIAPPSFPFSDREFLSALEESGTVGPAAGWIPQHISYSSPDCLQGLSSLYIKNHSYGEYIFDWAWAQAYLEHGLAYYPKLVGAVPFTPATGPKLLFASTADRNHTAAQLIHAAQVKMEEVGASSLHYLFLSPEEISYFEREGFLIRHSFQYHWKNREYVDFEAFLDSLKSRKRKQIVKERRELQSTPLTISVLSRDKLLPEHASVFFGFYRSTIEKMGAIAYLNLDFFRQIFETMKDRIVLFLAEENGVAVAGSLCLEKGDCLYGRYWGADREIRHLHFELCYYRPLEYAIQRRLRRFEAGAQGEHKIARGFLPELTYSAHWIRHPGFREAIARFIEEEKLAIQKYFKGVEEHSPYL